MARRIAFGGGAGALALLWLGSLVSCKEVPDLAPKCKEDGIDPAHALDLVDKGRDRNGILLAPPWRIQEAQAQVENRRCTADVLSKNICGGFPKVTDPTDPGTPYGGRPACSTQTTADPIGHEGVNDDAAHLLFSFISKAGPLLAHRPDWQHALLGHINWRPVTFTGWLSFDESGSADRDVNFALELDPEGGAPFTTKQLAADHTLPIEGGRLHLEIQADQAVHRFGDSKVSEGGHRPTDVPRFVQLANATDNEPGRTELRKQLWRKRAVATGLLALDLDHEVFAELHPLYSLAWQDSCAGNTETWAYMFANRGAQGWVSSGLNHHMALPTPSFTVELPTRFVGGAGPGDATRAVAETAVVDLRTGSATKVQYSIAPAPTGGRVGLTVLWPDAAPTEEVRVHGTVTLAWPAGIVECPALPPAKPVLPTAKAVPPHRVEQLGEKLEAEVKASKASGKMGPMSRGSESAQTTIDCRSTPSDCDDVKVEACSKCDVKWSAVPWTCPAGEVCDYLKREPARLEALRAEDQKAACEWIASHAKDLGKEFPTVEWNCPVR